LIFYERWSVFAAVFCALFATAGPSLSADLAPQPQSLAFSPSQWQFSFTPYLWLPWMTGDVVIKGRTLDVAVDPAELIDHLDWPVIVPAWMSHAEARRGPLSLFNDIVSSGQMSPAQEASLGHSTAGERPRHSALTSTLTTV
jgi:hypothetical protein